jgi:hypothetical protein
MKRHPLTAVVPMILAAALWAPAQETTTPAAGLTVETAQLDLGEIVAGQAAVGTFTFHNDGPEDIRIIRAKPS